MMGAHTGAQHAKRAYSSYVTHVFGPEHSLQSLCCLQKIDALIVKIQNFQAFRYYPANHSSRITARKEE